MSPLPLSGVRIIDMTRVLAGPWATRIMATLGAEVIKVESKNHLDFQRNHGTFRPGLGPPNGSATFASLNLSKRSFTVDLTRAQGRDILRELVTKSDVLVENFSYGVIDKLGFGYEQISRINPRIILLSFSALGRTGPEKHTVGYGHGFHAFSGLTYLTGYPGQGPGGIGGSWADPVGGTTGLFALMIALYHQRKTGRGQHIDLSLIEATATGLPEALIDYAVNGRNRGRRGNEDDIMSPHNTYRCIGDDTWVAIAVEDDTQWLALCGVMGRPDLISDPRFADAFGRWEHRAELDTLVEGWTRTQDNFELEHKLQGTGVPCSAVRDIRDLLKDEHLRARNFFARLPHPELGPIWYVTTPWRLSRAQPVLQAGSMLGEDNLHVLTAILGHQEAEAQRLMDAGIVG